MQIWWPCPYVIDSNVIQPKKLKVQNLLDEKVLQVECQQQKLILFQSSDTKGPLLAKNLQIYQSGSLMFTIQRFQYNWLPSVLHA